MMTFLFFPLLFFPLLVFPLLFFPLLFFPLLFFPLLFFPQFVMMLDEVFEQPQAVFDPDRSTPWIARLHPIEHVWQRIASTKTLDGLASFVLDTLTCHATMFSGLLHDHDSTYAVLINPLFFYLFGPYVVQHLPFEYTGLYGCRITTQDLLTYPTLSTALAAACLHRDSWMTNSQWNSIRKGESFAPLIYNDTLSPRALDLARARNLARHHFARTCSIITSLFFLYSLILEHIL
jgi:hypothetical protein